MISQFVRTTISIGAMAGFFLVSTVAQGQVKIGSKELQIHGFLQQGFAVSNNNNFLSMKTTDGSFSMTDGGINLSMRLTPKLRVGAQAFSRNIGDLGNGKVQLDWAFVDYRFNDFVGVRAGKVKTTLGLFTDTQDMEFVHTWALLPQSVYPTDLRATTIAHVGGDLYGDVSLRKAGRVSYVVYGGERPDDKRGGYYLGTRDGGAPISDFKSTVAGGDLRWATPIEGLTAGFSYFNFHGYAVGKLVSLFGAPFRVDLHGDTKASYIDFQRGKLRVYAEHRLTDSKNRLSWVPVPPSTRQDAAWYVAGSYRVHPKVELGSYYTNFIADRLFPFSATNGIRGPVATARFDINKMWNVKAEGHFVDGYAEPYSARTFYPSSNPGGLHRRSNLFLLRTGIVF
jgi:hypothetical protein